jgi:ABC-2 type transport system permease protein
MSAKRTNFRVTFAVAVVLLTAITFFLISVTGNLKNARIDMTSDQLFTMTPAAAKILKELEVPVQVKLYITPGEKMPTQLRNLERDISEQMRNFQSVSGGMLQYEVLNPQDDEEMQTALASKGVQPFQVRSVEKDEVGVKLIWSAMTIAYLDKPEEILPRILPQNLPALEQDVIGPVYRLTRPDAPKVAVFGPKKEVDQQMAMMYLQQGMQPPEPQEQFSMIPQILSQGHYETVPVNITEDSPIPEDVDLLIVMGITQLNERQVFEIGRVLQRGVPVVMAVQAHEYGYSPAGNRGWDISGQPVTTGLEPLLADLGVTVSTDHFFDMAHETIDLPREVNLGGLRMQTREPVKLPMQIRVTETQMDQDSALVNRIGSLFYIWGTPVMVDSARQSELGLTATTLVSSSGDCWSEPWSEGVLSPAIFRPEGKKRLGPQPLAVLIEGQFPDTYAGREVPRWPADPAAAAEGEESPLEAGPDIPAPVTPAPGQLLVIGSAKMFDDNIVGAMQNPLLLMNAADYLAGSQELLSIRSKILTQRVIKQVDQGGKIFWRVVTIFLVPTIFAIYGFTRAAMRRKEANRYRQELKRLQGSARHA